MKLLFTILFTFFSLYCFSQAEPELSPAFFTADEEITITYNVTSTSLANLSEAYLWAWLPDAGVDAPSNINPADSDNNATEIAKFTKFFDSGRTYFRISITLSDFFNVDASQITRVGLILKGNDWSDGQTGDYITEVSNGFAVNLQSPSGSYGFYQAGQTIPINFITSENATISYSVDGSLIEELSGISEYTTNHSVIADGNTHLIELNASNGTESLSRSYSYTTTPTVEDSPRPANTHLGINYLNDQSVTLVLEAPNKQNVFVIGDFNNWNLDNNYLMKRDGNYFWITLDGLNATEEYQFQYLVDGDIKIADPYSTKIASEFDDPQVIEEGRYPGLKPYPSGKTTEAVGYLQITPQAFTWQDVNFVKPAKEDLVIYELLIRDFTEIRTIEAVREKLDYLDSLGINAIELMPVMEFEGNLSWGYNPYAMLAFDKFYGTESDFKTFVNEAHQRGIAVILDIALNHQFGRNSLVRLYNEGLYGNPTSENPWFNTSAKHDFNVGYDMNHQSSSTQAYVKQIVQFWLEEYHVDGYRYDLSKGFTQKYTVGNLGAWGAYDATRVAIWKSIADHQWSIDGDSYVILEHFADNSEERELADYGMMLWGNLNHNYSNLAKGINDNISSLNYQQRGYAQPHLIGYMESHDEERVAYRLKSSEFSLAEQMQRLKMNAAFFFLVPGPKMLWQFGEFGYDEELNNDRLGIKPTHWEYLEVAEREQLFQVYQSMIKLKIQSGLLKKEDFSWSTTGELKWLKFTNDAFELIAVGNFSKSKLSFSDKIFSKEKYFDYFTGEELTIDFSAEDFSLQLAPGQFILMTTEKVENYIDDSREDLVVLSNKVVGTQSLNFYPNPAKSQFQILTNEKFEEASIYSMDGKRSNLILKPNRQGYTGSLTGLSEGVYLIRCSTSTGVFQSKILIK